jgi:nucleoside-diphosphate-sugar epimerase
VRYLVTGGGGFVGRALATELSARGAEVALLARDGSRTAETAAALGVPALSYRDVAQVPDLVAQHQPGVVIHLAAQQGRAPRGAAQIGALLEANVHLGALLLDGVRDSGAVVVQAMSYFQFRDGRPSVHSLYASTKEALRTIGAYYRDAAGVDVRDVVLYDNYGPGDPRDKLVPYLISALAADAVATVGPLDQSVNLLHVEDVVAGLLAAAAASAPAMTTVRAPEPTTVGAIIAAIDAASSRPLRIDVDARRGVTDLPLHAGEWPVPPGWAPKVSLESGLAQLVRAIPAHP